MFDPEICYRKSIRLPGYDYSQPGAYFITLCTYENKELFVGAIHESPPVALPLNELGLNQNAEIVKFWWLKLNERFPGIETDEYVVMPDHFHGIIQIGDGKANGLGAIRESPLRKDNKSQPKIQTRRGMVLSRIVGYFKMNTAKQINNLENTSGALVWQRNYYERVIRDERELNQIREYMRNNPVQWDEKHGK